MKVSPYQWLALSFFGYYCAYGVYMPLFPAWLKTQNYDAESIGLIIASAYLFRFVGGMLFASWVKKASQLIFSLRILAIAMTILMGLIGLTGGQFWLLFLGIAIFSMVNSASIPLTDTLATTWQNQVQLDYGRARLIGSMAFVIGVSCVGAIIGYVGDDKTQWILTILFAIYSLLQLVQPNQAPYDEIKPAQTQSQNLSFIALLKQPNTLIIMLVATLIQGSHAGYYVYSVMYWQQLGIKAELTTLLWGLSVCAEILLFFFSKRLFASWTNKGLLILSTLACVIRWALFGFATEFYQILVLQLSHCLTFATCHLAVMRYIAAQPQVSMAKLQSLYNGLANCAGVALMSIVAGMIYPHSPELMFAVMAFYAGIGMILLFRKRL